MVLIQRTRTAQLLEGPLLGSSDVLGFDHVAADGGHLVGRAGLAVVQTKAEADDVAFVRRKLGGQGILQALAEEG